MPSKVSQFDIFPKVSAQKVDINNPLSQIGQSIQRKRIAKEMTQETLAKLSGVSITTIRRLEQGDNVSLKVLCDVLETLGELKEVIEVIEAPNFNNVQQSARYLNNKKQRKRFR